ncbi:hypothetical protein R50073_42250 [Maricurvus nonylphenolicus]|uniref:M48 family metallopeptidase n=1 Tax=Maricurvus nonylphenolicus TaxID=1008307 RepID=UPI0036F31ACB
MKYLYLIGVVVLASMQALTTQANPLDADFPPGYRPDKNSDEGGFWYKVDKFEKELQSSPHLIRDQQLNTYISELTCNLASDYCGDIRTYIIQNPHFNASMYPNGMMHVWSGLLLRVENEAQLAAVLAHEIGHYLRSHQITQWRRLRDGASIATAFDVFLTGGLATLAFAGSSSAYGRGQELEADQYSLKLMINNGYDPEEAAKLWHYVKFEQEADATRNKRSSFFASHPQPENRAAQLEARTQILKQSHDTFHIRKERLVETLTPHYFDFMRNHIEMQEYEQTQSLLDKHIKMGYPASQVHYFRGLLATRQKEAGYIEQAIDAFGQSIAEANPPAESYKELGYLHLRNMQKTDAKQMFEQYLQQRPDASDKQMIEFYLSSLGQ